MELYYCINCMNKLSSSTKFCPKCGCRCNEDTQQYFGLKPHSILHGRYIVGRILGQGGFGITYIGFDLLLNIKVAIKEYYPRMNVSRDWRRSNALQWNVSAEAYSSFAKGLDSFLREAQRMAKIDYIPEIVRIRDTFSDNNTAYIIMDYVEGITLKEYILKNGAMDLRSCLKLLAPIASGLEKVHAEGLIHRDISPDNIMLRPDGSVRLLDFGAAKDATISHDSSSEKIAKNGFSPAEQYTEKGNIGPWTDVYAFCATIYYCVTGKVLQNAVDRIIDDKTDLRSTALSGSNNNSHLFSVISRFAGNRISSFFEPGITMRHRSALAAGLAVDPQKRIKSMGELIKRLDIPVSDRFSITRFVQRHKLSLAAAVAAVAVFIWIMVAKPWIVSVETIGITSSNSLNEGNFAYTEGEYAYYISENGDLIVSSFDNVRGSFDAGKSVAPNASDINISDGKVYFATFESDNKTEVTAPDVTVYLPIVDICSMNADGSGIEVVYSGISVSCVQYVTLSNGREYLYFFEFDESGNKSLYSYDMKSKKKTAVGGYEITWYCLMDQYIYYVIPESSTNLKFMRCKLNGKNETLLDNSNLYYCGVCSDDGLFMYSILDGAVHGCDMDGVQTGFVLNGICLEATDYYVFPRFAYGNGYIYYVNRYDMSLHIVDPNQVYDEILLKNEMPDTICYCNGYIWIGEIVTDGVDTELTSASILKENGKARTDLFISDKWRNNILVERDLDTVFGNTSISEESITSVTFKNDLIGKTEDAWDVSADGSGSVYAWVTENGEDMYDLYIGANGGINAREVADAMFMGFTELRTVRFGRYLHTDEAKSTEFMFYSCEKLKDADVYNLNTSSCEKMGAMFEYCGLEELDLRNFDTSNVTDMSSMFAFSESLKKLDVSSFDTSKVTDMSYMFCWASGLTSLDVSGFDTSNVTNMKSMFAGCSGIKDLDISGFDMSNVQNKEGMLPE